MPRRKKGTVRPGRGARCLICGRDCGKGGGLRHHIEGTHLVPYDMYKRCFKGGEAVVNLQKADEDGDLFVHIRVLKAPKTTR